MSTKTTLKTDATAPGDVSALVDSWMLHLRSANRSPRTIETYREATSQFEAFLRDRGMPQMVHRITREHVETFVAYLIESRSPATASVRYRALQQWFRWMHVVEGEISTNPMANMQPPRVPEPITPVLSDAAVNELIGTCSGRNFESVRDAALLYILGDCGLRLSEVAGLRYTPNAPETNDVFIAEGIVKVLGKNQKQRLVHMGAATTQLLDRYIRKRSRHPRANLPALWIGHRGPLTPNGIRQLIRKRARKAGIGNVHPHMLRHTTAHNLALAGMSETDLMTHMGWSSSQMAKRYGKSAASIRAIEAHKRFSPMDRLQAKRRP